MDSWYFQINGWSSLCINLEVWFSTFNWSFGDIFILSCFLTKRLIFSQNIFPGQSFVKRSQIKDSLQMDNLSINLKVGVHAYISDNLSSQISKLVSKSGQSQKDKIATCTKVLARSLQGNLENIAINYLFLKRWFIKLPVGSFCNMYICILVYFHLCIHLLVSNKRTYRNNYI